MKLLKKSLTAQWGRGAQAAFTMVEIALCLAIIGFALVAIIGILPTGMSVQKDNRQDTIISMDATYLMETLRSGARGPDLLTNHIVSITNYHYHWESPTNKIYDSFSVDWFTTNRYSLNGVPYTGSYLTNSSNVIGLLTIPKYVFEPGLDAGFTSNFTTADFRPMTSPLVDQGQSQASRDFAFSYRLYPQIIPFHQYDHEWVNFNAQNLQPADVTNRQVAYAEAVNLRNNLHEMRLRFEWPVLPSGDTGNGRQVFRTFAGGSMLEVGGPSGTTPTWFIQPQAYSTNYTQ